MWEAVGAIVAVLAAVGGLVTWLMSLAEKADRKRREREQTSVEELRITEVAHWASDTIAVAQGLVVAIRFKGNQIGDADRRTRVREALISLSISVERGRLFFRNCVIDDFGATKEPAYRGYRPRILDPLVVLYQVADRYLDQGDTPDPRLLAVAEDAARRFVSLAQVEVGRSRAASADTGSSGDGANLDYLLQRLPALRLDRACPGPTT